MQPKEYDILRRAVDDGISVGLGRYHQRANIRNAVYMRGEGEVLLMKDLSEAIVDEICKWFDFPEALLYPPNEEPGPE